MAKPRQTPTAIAAHVVSEWFTEVTGNMGALTGDARFPDLDAAIDQIREALLTPDPSAPGRDELASQEAAYLIGVQVGLRLRGGTP